MDASFYSMILDGLADPLFVLDGQGNYVFVNNAYCNQLRIPGSELFLYPGLGHAAYEEADDFNERVFRFLEES